MEARERACGGRLGSKAKVRGDGDWSPSSQAIGDSSPRVLKTKKAISASANCSLLDGQGRIIWELGQALVDEARLVLLHRKRWDPVPFHVLHQQLDRTRGRPLSLPGRASTLTEIRMRASSPCGTPRIPRSAILFARPPGLHHWPITTTNEWLGPLPAGTPAVRFSCIIDSFIGLQSGKKQLTS